MSLGRRAIHRGAAEIAQGAISGGAAAAAAGRRALTLAAPQDDLKSTERRRGAAPCNRSFKLRLHTRGCRCGAAVDRARRRV